MLPDVIASAFIGRKKLKTGQYFLKEGKICDEIGIVTKGMCRHYYKSKNGDATRWIALTGTFVTSLRSFINQIPSIENIQAMQATEISIMKRADWLAIYKKSEEAREYWTKIMEVNYVGMEERVVNLITKSAEERYYWMIENQPEFIEKVPDKYLASMLGTHPRHLSRIRAMKK